MTHPVYLKNLHYDCRLWANELRFCKEEIAIFEARLGELVTKNTNKDMLAELEHFQNQFIRQNELIDELAHEIKLADAELAKFAQDHTTATDRIHMQDHPELREKMDMFRKRYADLKADFQRFSAKWM